MSALSPNVLFVSCPKCIGKQLFTVYADYQQFCVNNQKYKLAENDTLFCRCKKGHNYVVEFKRHGNGMSVEIT